MTAMEGPGGTRSADGGSHFERITRLRAARREVLRIAHWIRIVATVFAVSFALAAVLWLVR